MRRLREMLIIVTMMILNKYTEIGYDVMALVIMVITMMKMIRTNL